jgi:hypothetical protein
MAEPRKSHLLGKYFDRCDVTVSWIQLLSIEDVPSRQQSSPKSFQLMTEQQYFAIHFHPMHAFQLAINVILIQL